MKKCIQFILLLFLLTGQSLLAQPYGDTRPAEDAHCDEVLNKLDNIAIPDMFFPGISNDADAKTAWMDSILTAGGFGGIVGVPAEMGSLCPDCPTPIEGCAPFWSTGNTPILVVTLDSTGATVSFGSSNGNKIVYKCGWCPPPDSLSDGVGGSAVNEDPTLAAICDGVSHRTTIEVPRMPFNVDPSLSNSDQVKAAKDKFFAYLGENNGTSISEVDGAYPFGCPKCISPSEESCKMEVEKRYSYVSGSTDGNGTVIVGNQTDRVIVYFKCIECPDSLSEPVDPDGAGGGNDPDDGDDDDDDGDGVPDGSDGSGGGNSPSVGDMILIPNPSSGPLDANFFLDMPAGNASLHVTDYMMNPMLMINLGALQPGPQSHMVNLTGFPPGIYHIELEIDGMSIDTETLMLN